MLQGRGDVSRRVSVSARLQSRVVFHSSLSNQSNDLQRQRVEPVGSLLAGERQSGHATGRRGTSLQSVDLLGPRPVGHELDVLVLLRLESDHGQFLSNAERFSDGLHSALQVSERHCPDEEREQEFLFSILLLRKKLTPIQGLGILTVVAGLVVVGLVDLYFDKQTQGNHTVGEKVAGVVLILVAMVFTSLQVSGRASQRRIFHPLARLGRLRGTVHREIQNPGPAGSRLGRDLRLLLVGCPSGSGKEEFCPCSSAIGLPLVLLH